MSTRHFVFGLVLVSTLGGAVGSAFAEGPAGDAAEPAVGGPLGYVRPTEADGFGDVKWGADLKALHAKFPALKKLYPAGKVMQALKGGQTVILETKLPYKGRTYDGRLYLDDGGLFRATLELVVTEEPGTTVSIDKALDPVLGDLSTADEETPETRVWKGAATVVAVTKTQQVGSYRLNISFHAKAKYRPENAGGSLGIE